MNQNQFGNFFSQIIDFMNAVQRHDGPLKELTPELKKEIDNLETEFNRLYADAKQCIEEATIDPKTLRIETMRSSEVPAENKRMFDRAKQVERDIKALNTEMKKVTKNSKAQKDPLKGGKPGKGATKQEIKERRKRFKPIGGDKDWLPL